MSTIPVPPPLPDQNGAQSKPVPKLLLHPDLIRYYGPAGPPKETPIQDQIKMLAMRQGMVMAGAKRIADNLPARAGGKLVQPGAAPTPAADPPVKWSVDPIAQDQVIAYLKEAFYYGTPKDGAVFWTGIDANKLVKQVDGWNADVDASRKAKTVARQTYGQLEATTDARLVNKAFEWNAESQKYWGAVSQKYGHGALGHVTAAQLFGFKEKSIFLDTELPAILKSMADKLKEAKSPDVVDITIVAIDPLDEPGKKVKFFTNLDIAKVVIYKAKPNVRFASKLEECEKVRLFGHSAIPLEVRKYWAGRGPVAPSGAAQKIAANPKAILYGP